MHMCLFKMCQFICTCETLAVSHNTVREAVLSDIKRQVILVSVNSTPDVSHVDQLTVIGRYVSPSNGSSVEHLFEQKEHTSESMNELILNYFIECEIDFSKCRGQSYDKAADNSWKI